MKIVFVDLLMRISASSQGGGGYSVEATIDGDSFFYGGELRFPKERLKQLAIDADGYGRELLDALFSEPILRAYERAAAKAEECCDGRLRIRLQIDPNAAQLQSVWWERLYAWRDGKAVPIAVSSRTPFARFTGLEEASAQPLSERPLRLLVAVSNPTDLETRFAVAPVDVEGEVQNLMDGLSELVAPNELEVGILSGRTALSGSLAKALSAPGYRLIEGVASLENLSTQMRGYHVVHFIGHGAFQQGTALGEGTAALLLEAPDGSAVVAQDVELVPKLTVAHPLPHLFYLAACESASRGEDSVRPFVGLGPKLVAAGVPAVVAMQDKVPMALSTALSRRFYQALFRDGIIDQALNEARSFLYEAKSADWSIPVLFMRVWDGRLFVPHPLHEALKQMVQWSRDEFAYREPPLPVEVVRVPSTAGPESLQRLELSEEAGYDIGAATCDLLLTEGTEGPRFVVLLGREGTGKSTHLTYVVGEMAERSLAARRDGTLIPVLLDVKNSPQAQRPFAGSIEHLFLENLQRFWPALGIRTFQSLLADPKGPTFVFLVDGSDALSERCRQTIWEQLGDFACRNKRHRFLLVSDLHRFQLQRLPVTDFLVVKLMSFRRVDEYLRGRNDGVGGELLAALSRARLFDLASLPWLLVHMLKQARFGQLPSSRTSVLQNFVDSAVSQISSGKGMRTRAPEALRALAWEMHASRRKALSEEEALEILAKSRGNWEFYLHDLLQAFVDKSLLRSVGQGQVEFAYPAIQAYCCATALHALPNWEEVVDDITATLGRHSRLRWWADTLVLLSGMTDEIDTLVGLVLHGGGFGHGEQVFLAARCIEEKGPWDLAPEVLDQVTDALVWRARSDNEPSVPSRTRAIRALGRLQADTAIPHLVSIAIDPVRLNWGGKRVTEYSSVRLAAIGALRTMPTAALEYLRAHRPELADLLEYWIGADVGALGTCLTDGDARKQCVAAFMLSFFRSNEAIDLLISSFYRTDVSAEVRWALTDALAMTDPSKVVPNAVLPFIDKAAAESVELPTATWRRRSAWYERIAYLIGKVKPTDERAHTFLERCIYKYHSVWLKARAMRAVGAIQDSRYKDVFEDLALGDFSRIAVSKKWKAGEVAYLRHVAMQTLAEIGDEETVYRLRPHRGDWDRELAQAFYLASEEIYVRSWSAGGYGGELDAAVA